MAPAPAGRGLARPVCHLLLSIKFDWRITVLARSQVAVAALANKGCCHRNHMAHRL